MFASIIVFLFSINLYANSGEALDKTSDVQPEKQIEAPVNTAPPVIENTPPPVNQATSEIVSPPKPRPKPKKSLGTVSVLPNPHATPEPSVQAAPSVLPKVTAPAPVENENEDPAVRELLEARRKTQEQLTGINALNPLSDTSLSQADPDKLPPQLKWIVPIMTNPKLKNFGVRLAGVVQNPEFQKNVQEILNSRNHKTYAGVVLIFVIIYFFIKFRVLASTDRWFVRFFLRCCLWVAFLTAQGLIAAACYGQPMVSVLMSIYRII